MIRTSASPYRGLAAFGESDLDGESFFGRERETEVTTANLLASRLTVIYGPSGVGKSSLVRAGVARRVRELGARRAVGRGPDLACVVFSSWAEDPVARLAEAIEAAVRPLVSPTALPPPAASPLADVAEHWSAVLDGDLCIVLDQLEEYFVYHEHDERPGAFLWQLADLVLRAGLRANVLIALRDDQLARLGALKPRIPNVFANARPLERLDRDSARAAILGPLQSHPDVDVEQELVEAVLEETSVRGEPGRVEAPYLQLVMQRVWEAESEAGSGALRLETLRDLGGAESIVRDHLERALDGLDDDEQTAAALMFEHLVTPSGTKIAHRAGDLAAFARIDVADGQRVLQSLGRERIVRPLDDAGGERYEIFHDVLAEAVLEWGRRRELILERDQARRHQRRLGMLAVAALLAALVMVGVTVYALGQRSDARAQTRHASAAALAADALSVLSADPQRSLVLAARAARREPSAETEAVLRTALLAARGRAVLGGNHRGVLAAGFSAGGVVTVDGAGVLHRFAPRSGGPASSTVLGGRVRAAAIASSGDAVAVARRRLVELRPLRPGTHGFAFRAPEPVRTVAVDRLGEHVAVAMLHRHLIVRDRSGVVLDLHPSFDATTIALGARGRLLVAANGHQVRVWLVATGRLVASASERGDVTGLAVAPDGATFATASTDGAARIRALPEGDTVTTLVANEPLRGVIFSPDGAVVVTEGSNGLARVFDAPDGHPVAVLAGHTDAVATAAFSPDSRSLVTGSADGTARLWDPGVAPELRVVSRPAGCCAALATGAGGTLAAAGNDVLLFRGGQLERRFPQHARTTAVAFAGSTPVSGGVDGRVRVWGAQPFVLDGGAPVTALAADSAHIVAANGATVTVWTANGRKLRSFQEPAPVDGLALSVDGLVATAGLDHATRLHDLASGVLRRTLHGHSKAVTSVAFSPDGRSLATASVDHDVRIWDASTGRPGPVLRVHFAQVSGIAFSADGRWLVSAGPTSAGLFRMPGAIFLDFLRGHSARLVGAGFAADDRTVMTASIDGTIRSYRCDVCGTLPELLKLADARVAAAGR